LLALFSRAALALPGLETGRKLRPNIQQSREI
jgi:hypothetical protein